MTKMSMSHDQDIVHATLGKKLFCLNDLRLILALKTNLLRESALLGLSLSSASRSYYFLVLNILCHFIFQNLDKCSSFI